MLAMHMQQPLCAAAFVQVINILRNNQQRAFPFGVQTPQREMRGIGFLGLNRFAPHVVETQDKVGVARKSLGCRDILDAMLFPQTAASAKGIDPAFRADPRTGQDHNVSDFNTHPIHSVRPELVKGQLFLLTTVEKRTRQCFDKLSANGLGQMTAIGIIGSEGRMGHALREAIAAAGHSLAGGVDKDGDLAALIAVSDVLVDFSSPAALERNLDACVAGGKPIVIGTTGLEERHHYLIDTASDDIPVLQTGNTSLGVTMLAALVKQAASQLGNDWDIEIVEMHHRHKVDAPSGTALLLGEAAAEGRGIDLAANSERGRDGITGARKPSAIGFASLRGGSVPGDHSVLFASDNELITLSHRAENRSIFAKGAVTAAQWLASRQPGRYQMAEVLGL